MTLQQEKWLVIIGASIAGLLFGYFVLGKLLLEYGLLPRL